MSKTNPHLLVESGGVNNMSASFNSDSFFLGGTGKSGIHVRANNGTHVGTLTVQVSNDGSNWCDTSLTAAFTSGNVDNTDLELDTGLVYVRVSYAFTSGDGQLDVIANKRLNN